MTSDASVDDLSEADSQKKDEDIKPVDSTDSKGPVDPVAPNDDLAETKPRVKEQFENLVGLDDQTKDELN
ncbi:hypothetical protein [Weissella viridescens]|nr:hypothetical protein [Weissella viridescens]